MESAYTVLMSQADEERARQKYADKMREASARAKAAAAPKKPAKKKKKTVREGAS
jgi:hypothetical protein